jgi:hypothetical protein
MLFCQRMFGSILATCTIAAAAADLPPVNYDEAKVPQYTLPDPLVLENGRPVTDADTWRNVRRGQIVQLFETNMYGKAPPRPACLRFVPVSTGDALDGLAVRKQLTIRFTNGDSGPPINVLLYLPKKKSGPVPVFVGLNFEGNHTIHRDPGIALAEGWLPVGDHRAHASQRGSAAHRWPVELILARGYGLATAYYGDIEPDRPDATTGVRHYYQRTSASKPAADQWGAIAAWAWGLSRIMDYLATDKDVDARHVAVIGHSRLGKTALWAGAHDERFALVISNDSGCGGASLARRGVGETPLRITTAFPHWFCGNYKHFAGHVNDLPVDQHMVMALVAPRPLYVASAEEDRWADPHGEFLSAKAASPVYRLLGAVGLPATEMPTVEEPIMGTIAYHIRHGKHDVTRYDWQQYLAFADRQFKRSK